MEGFEAFETYTFPTETSRTAWVEHLPATGCEFELRTSEDVNEMHNMFFLHLRVTSKTFKQKLTEGGGDCSATGF